MLAALRQRLSQFGPGILVTAAFIGPGTIATASSAGASYGFALLWALMFSVGATIVLQEMAARLGLVTQSGLAEAMRTTFTSRWLGGLAVVLVVAAVGLGNAAYEAGNIAGAALALSSLGGLSIGAWAIGIGIGAAALLASGHYRLLERVLIALVLTMSAVFLLTAVVIAPPIGDILKGAFIPSLPEGSMLMVLALIGTTVVPYNLFLHANAVREKWPENTDITQSLREARWDTGLSIGLGGLITLAIVSTAATAFFQGDAEFTGKTLGSQLEPLLGPWARYVFAAGLFAGGLTSAITAPLAAGYAVCGALGVGTDLRHPVFRGVWLTVLVIGTVFAAIGTKPLTAILFAQVANGFLLPFVAVFLLIVMNRRDLLGEHINGALANALGVIVVLVAFLLGLVKIASVVGWL
ncbi:Nramp family divalent metal transporter [Parahalioglobus pacificus]|uniref:Manganese transporter n=1 Tax=Parahalioglobus pacificus TaxID=930806 RepID=A0A918XHZ8_9GAMM|nr:Nramp family divalent metal transporter [Halioglobus pacificus]GHD32831.1 manganese transporter [Halioglobus pacificus]